MSVYRGVVTGLIKIDPMGITENSTQCDIEDLSEPISGMSIAENCSGSSVYL